MTEPVSSSSSSSSSSVNDTGRGGMTIDIRPMIEDVSQVMTKHITNILSGVIGEYTVYKETHDTIMGLPCVRRLQERINELEMPCDNTVATAECGGGGGVGSSAPSREDEIHQLQSAIAELNRYIVALESKVDMKTVYSPPSVAGSTTHNEEESIRLEIHENTTENTESEFVVPCSNSKNVIITSSTIPEEPEDDATTEDLAAGGDDAEADSVAEEEEAAEEEEEAEEDTEADAVVEEEEADEEEEEAEEDTEADAVVEAEEEAEEAEADEEAEEDTEADAVVEAEDTEADAVVEAEEEAEEAEAEIEVSEVKIKGKTYFTTDPQNGIIYACVDDDVGDEVGVFKNGVAVFNKGKK